MISIYNLTFQYKKNSPVFSDITFDFLEGNIYVLQGANGIGKTTLIKLLLNLLKPSKGEISCPKEYTFSYLPDNNGIYDNLTIIQNIKFRLGLYNLTIKDKNDEIENWLNGFGLLELKNKKVKVLSLGNKKKVAIICACLIASDLLILDEPLNGLDKDARAFFLVQLKNLINRNRIIIIVSHENDFNDTVYKRIVLNKTTLYQIDESGVRLE